MADNNSPDDDSLWDQATQWQESRNNPNAVSPAGAVGLMQTLPSTLKDPGYGVTPAKDNSSEEMQRVGQDYRKAMFNKYGDPTLGLMAYNWGPKNVDNWIASGGDPKAVPAETKDYVSKVNKYHDQLAANNQPQTTTISGPETPVGSSQVQSGMTPADEVEQKFGNVQPTAASSTSTGLTPFDEIEQKYGNVKPTAPSNTQSTKPTASATPPTTEEKNPTFSESVADTLRSAPGNIVSGVNRITNLPIGIASSINQLGTQLGDQAHNLLYSYTRPGDASQQYSPEEIAQNTKNAAINYQAPTLNELTGGTLGRILAGNSARAVNALTGGNLSDADIVEATNAATPEQLEAAMPKATTPMGKAAGQFEQALPAGLALGFGPKATAIGVGIQDEFPNNPEAQAAAGLAFGGLAKGAKAVTTGPAPELVADNVLQQTAKYNGGNLKGQLITPNNIDLSEKIPGSSPTLAEATGSGDLAALERQNPVMYNAKEAEREKARQEYWQNATGSKEDVDTAKTNLKNQVDPIYKQSENQPLDPTPIKPILDKIDENIEKVGAENDAGKALALIKSKILAALPGTKSSTTGMLDAEGNPTTSQTATNTTQNPLVTAFREMRNKLDSPKYNDPDAPLYAAGKTYLQPIVAQLGEAIKSQSSTFAKAQDIYAQQMPKIKAMQWLQDLDLKDSNQNFTLNKVGKALDNAKSAQETGDQQFAPEQLDALQNLHSDLLRRNQTQNLAKTFNSTTQHNKVVTNALNSGISGRVSSFVGEKAPTYGAATGAALGAPFGSIGSGVGAYLGETIGKKLAGASVNRAAAANASVQNYLFNPQEYKQYLINKLQK